MPRVHTVKKARKADPRNGIAVGDKYYWWKFKNRFGNGTVVKSKTYPKPSQLTRSEFNSAYLAFAERIDELSEDDGLYDALQEIAGELRDLGSEQEDKRSNMPDGLQDSDSGQLLEQRAEACNGWADEIEGLEEPSRETAAEEVEEVADFIDFIDSYEIAEPQRADFANEVEEFIEYLDAFQGWAEEMWEAHKAALEQREQDIEERYAEMLSELKSAAQDADPGMPS